MRVYLRLGSVAALHPCPVGTGCPRYVEIRRGWLALTPTLTHGRGGKSWDGWMRLGKMGAVVGRTFQIPRLRSGCQIKRFGMANMKVTQPPP